MKIHKIMVAALTILLMMSGGFFVLDVKADNISEGEKAVLSDTEVPVPMFSAYIEYSFQGYVVKGTFTEFTSDISLIRPMYSLDGENWNTCGQEWDLHWLDMEGEAALEKLQTQTCLYASDEPFSSYLAGKLDRFYLKLCLIKENGSAYETQAAMLERGESQPLPQDFNAIAKFDRSVFVSEMGFYSNYGRYQLTISADATAEDIAALLPDTLPIEIQFQRDNIHVTEGIVDCPVTWKPLKLPQLIAGDSVVIMDAAEEIVIPDGTLVNTPIGIFQLNEPLRIDQFSLTDEVRLVLNVVAEDGNPTGVLIREKDGLEMAFDLKPTGATAIHAYTFSEGDFKWRELSDLSLLEAVNSQPSAANSGYALVLGEDSELFQNYLAEKAAGGESTPLYVGLEIEGGVYDGRQLVLAWPNTYHVIPKLPDIRGSGGNEGNAGADNKGDSTEGGQRPNMPQDTAEVPGEGQPEQFQDSGRRSTGEVSGFRGKTKEERLGLEQSPNPGDGLGGQWSDLPQDSRDRLEERQSGSQVITDAGVEEIRPTASPAPSVKIDIPMSEKRYSNTKISSHRLSGPILPMMVIAISCICIIVVIGRRAVGRKS